MRELHGEIGSGADGGGPRRRGAGERAQVTVPVERDRPDGFERGRSRRRNRLAGARSQFADRRHGGARCRGIGRRRTRQRLLSRLNSI